MSDPYAWLDGPQPAEQPQAQTVDDPYAWLDEAPKTKKAKSNAPELRAYKPTERDRVGRVVADAAEFVGVPRGQADKVARGLIGSSGLTGDAGVGVVDFLPGPGNLLAWEAAKRSFGRGDYLSGMLNTAGAALPPISGATRLLQQGGQQAQPRLSEIAARLNRTPGAPEVTVPKALDPNPGIGSQGAAQIAQRTTGLPFLGAPTRKAAERGADALRDRFEFATGLGRALPPAPDDVGRAIKTQADGYVAGTSKDVVGLAYDNLRRAIPPDFKGQLPELTKLLAKLKAEQAESTSKVGQPVIDKIEEAVSRGSLSIQGAETLKRELSKLGKPALAIGESATAGPQFKRAAAALNKDIAGMLKQAGGPAAQKAMAAAKDTYITTARSRRAAERFVGKRLGDDTVAGETVLAKLYSAAGSTSKADIQSLIRFKSIIGENEWNQASRAMHARMATKEGEQNLLQWAKNFNNLSDRGKQALFGAQAKELTDLAKFTSEYMRKFNALGNPSRSGELGAILAGAAALTTQPIPALLTGAKIMSISRIMAEPRKMRALKAALKLGVVPKSKITKSQQLALRSALVALTAENDRPTGQ